MTPAKSDTTNVVVVDGSNIATEGRSMPSLTQLNDAVMAFTEEFPDAVVTVVVDATFGHRIDKSELAEFDAAVAHNEVVAPPAGAIGRGDAFVLSIANKVGARILSNDSFQEFHGEYPWLFDEGRLIGGKPVPFVGWVFVERLPVKGPVSRKATRSSRGGGRDGRDGREGREGRDNRSSSRRPASREASLPMPVPSAPPPGVRRGERSSPPAAAPASVAPERAAAVPTGGPVNDLLPFLDFVEHHPVGSSVNGVVESYSSHGAYVAIGDVLGYVPLRLMGEPPPRSAREVMKLGDAVTLVVTSFAPARRSIDLSIPKVALVGELVPNPALEGIAEELAAAKPARRRSAKKSAAPEPVAAAIDEAVAEAALEVVEAPVLAPTPPVEAAPPARVRKAATKKKAPAKKAPAKKKAAAAAAPAVAVATAAAAAAKAPAKKASAKKAATEAPATKAPAKAKKAAATTKKKAPAAKAAAAPAKRTARARAAAPQLEGA